MSNKPPQKPPLKKPSPSPETLNPDDYRHSPVHYAVATHDHTSLSHIISSLPKLSDPTRIHSHSDSLTQEKISDQISSLLDRRDNAGGETALHVAVKVNDTYSARALANAGADVSLQNKQGWNALQEAVVRQCTEIVAVLVQCHHVSAWWKWRRRLPLLTLALRGMRDFYMEISFHFESSIVPFVGKIAPSDTYKIWKRGCNVRADTSLAGYDGLKIQRANQSFLFLGDGDENLEIPSGSLIVLNHDDKRIYDAFENAGVPLSESDIASFCAQTSVYRPGMDVTKAELLATTNWRRQKKVETVGEWKARVYEIQNVHFSFRSRKIVQNSNNDSDQIMPLELVEDSDDDGYFVAECPRMCVSSNIPDCNRDRPRRRHSSFVGGDREVVSVSRKSVDIIPEPRRRRPRGNGNPPPVVPMMRMTSSPPRVVATPVTKEKEYVKTLKPSVWLTDDFPLKTEELLPLLDILANKVKAVRRMRELLTTKFPQGTFPVKVAIPVVPTVRVMITFTKFVELPPLEEQFFTPFSSPRHLFSGRGDDDKDDDDKGVHRASVSSRFSRSGSRLGLLTHKVIPHVAADPFDVPVGYSWSSFDEKGKKLKKSKSTARKAK